MSADTSNPYVGLRPFEFDESLLFFGRNDQILELLQRLHAHHFVAVVGSSGSGKSSLLRAGLIPALKAGYLVDDSDHWVIPIMKPGQNPIYNLAEAILKQINPSADNANKVEFTNQITEEGADAIIHKISLNWQENKTNFFVLIDQFEELFRFAMDQKDLAKKDEAIDFVNIMLELAKQKLIPIYVVITMRSDFIGDCSQFPGLPEAMNVSQYLVPKLNRLQLKTVIEAPARLYGGKLNPALTSRLLNEIGKVKDELPLLQHTLMRIWDYEANINKSGELNIEDYEGIGGIAKALSNHADEAIVGMNEAEITLTRELFQALTTIDENGRKIRRPKKLSNLIAITGSDKESILKIINRFNEDKRSFLVLNNTGKENDIIIDISHESLMRVWERLTNWVDDEAESVTTYNRVCESALLHSKNLAGLWRDPELQTAIDWQKNTNPNITWANQYNVNYDLAIKFIKDSEKEKQVSISEKAKTKLITRISVIAALIIMAGLSIFAFSQSNKAQSLLVKAKDEKIKALILKEKYKKAKLAADSAKIGAYKLYNEVKISQELLKEALIDAEVKTKRALKAEFKAKHALIIVKHEKIRAEEAQRHAYREQKKADSLATIANNEKIEATNQKELAYKLRMLSIAQNLAIKSAQAKKGTYSDNEVKPLLALQANNFYNNYGDKKIDSDIFTALFSATRFVQPDLPYINKQNTNLIRSVAYSPDGKTLASASSDGNIFVYNSDNIQVAKIKFTNQIATVIENIVFNNNGNKIIATTSNKTILIYSLTKAAEKPIELSYKHPQIIKGIIIKDDEIYTISSDNLLRQIKTDGTLVKQVAIPSTTNCIAINNTKNKIAIGCADGKIYTLDIVTLKPMPFRFITHDKINTITYDNEGKNIVSGTFKGDLIISSLIKQEDTKIYAHTANISGIKFIPNSNLMATSSYDGKVKLWNTEDTDEPPIVFSEHSGWVWDIDVNKDGTQLVSGGKDRKVRTYPLIQADLIKIIEPKVHRNLTEKEWQRFVAKKGVLRVKTIEKLDLK